MGTIETTLHLSKYLSLPHHFYISIMQALSQDSKKKWILILIVVVVVFLLIIVRPQQHNIYELDRKIDIVKRKIDLIEFIGEKIKLEKDILIIEKDKVIINNGMYTNSIQALGSVVLAITAYIAYLNFTIGEKNLKLTEEKQVTERFSRAIEHLGSEKIDVRLGGIYALEQIAITSQKTYHWTIVEILSAFIRERCRTSALTSDLNDSESGGIEIGNPFVINSQTSSNQTKKICIDIQAAITVLGRRNVELENPEEQYMNLMEVNLAGINMNNGNFSHANFIGSDLSGATLWNAKLINCHLDCVNLHKARLTYADLTKASLSGYPDTDGHILFTNLREANLIGANFSETNLSGANLSYTFLHGTNFSKAILCQVILERSHLGGIKHNNILLDGADFTEANLSLTMLDHVEFQNANLSNTNLNNSSLSGANLSQAKNLTRDQLTSANITNAQSPNYLS